MVGKRETNRSHLSEDLNLKLIDSRPDPLRLFPDPLRLFPPWLGSSLLSITCTIPATLQKLRCNGLTSSARHVLGPSSPFRKNLGMPMLYDCTVWGGWGGQAKPAQNADYFGGSADDAGAANPPAALSRRALRVYFKTFRVAMLYTNTVNIRS